MLAVRGYRYVFVEFWRARNGALFRWYRWKHGSVPQKDGMRMKPKSKANVALCA